MTYKIPNFIYEHPFTIIIDGRYQLSNQEAQIVEVSDVPAAHEGYNFKVDTGGHVSMQFKGNPTSDPVTVFSSTKSLQEDQDFSLAFVQDTFTGKGIWSFYINGVQEGKSVPKKPFTGQVVCFFLSISLT